MKSLRRVACIVAAMLCGAGAAHGQDTASLTGTVKDNSGAVLVGADVTVSNKEIGLNRTAKTNADGEFLFAALPPGPVTLEVSARGFKRYEAKDVILRVAQKVRLDVTLEIGELTAQVTVTGEKVAQVETQSSEIAGTVTGREMTQLQLNGRDFVQLITLSPGVNNQSGQDEGTVGQYGSILYSINGGRQQNNNFEVDGGDMLDNGSNETLTVYPSIDSISEVRVLTSNFGAQYGRNASGTVETELKSGTRAFHGGVYEFVRNDIFNAKSFFDVTTPPYKKNDFGYNIGGPIFIPNHYNTDKSKTFFFWSEEWRLERLPNTVNFATPSNAERMGDFTDECPNLAGSFADCPHDNAIPGQIVGNHVSAIDPNAQAILAEIPAPNNAPGTNTCQSTIGSCFVGSISQPTYWRQELVRVDHNFNPKVRGMFHYIHDSWNTTTPTTLWSNATLPLIQTKFVAPATSAVARLAVTASPTLLNEFVFSYSDDHIFLTNTGPFARPDTMTMTGLFNNGFGGKLPAVTLAGNAAYPGPSLGAFSGLFTADPSYEPWNNADPTFTIRDNVTKIVGKHNLQFGAYGVFVQKNEFSSLQDGGALTFDASNTNVSTGNSFADMLLGNIANFSQANQNLKYHNKYTILEPYFQDDFHVTSRVTLNLGLRVSLFGMYYEKDHNAFNWSASVFNPANQLVIGPNGELDDPNTGLPVSPNDPRVFNGIMQCGVTTSAFPGVAGGPRSCMKGHLFNPAPRVGFAWDIFGDGKTSLRGGYGIFYDHGNGNNEANTEALEGSPPLVQQPTQVNIIPGPGCAQPTGYTCIGANGGGAFAFPLGVAAIPGKARWTYAQQWSLSLQHELWRNTVGTLAYVGSKGTNLARQRDLNQLQPVPAALNPYTPGVPLSTNDCNTGFANGVDVTTLPAIVQQDFSVACGGDPSPFRPFVGYASITSKEYTASSNYNSLQVAVRRTLAPLVLSFAYTYSHSIDDASDSQDVNFVNSFNTKANRASSNFDERHILSASYIYEIPSFHESGITKMILGNWAYSGIVTFYTGTPFSVTNGVFGDNAGVANGVGANGSYPDLIGDPHAAPPAGAVAALAPGSGPLLFNPDAFAAPQGLTFGNSGRNSLNSPHRINFDMALYKSFPIRESISFQFRTEAFNIFNHTEWSGVNSGISCYGGANNSAGDPSCFGTGFLQPSGAHLGRILQFGLKLLF